MEGIFFVFSFNCQSINLLSITAVIKMYTEMSFDTINNTLSGSFNALCRSNINNQKKLLLFSVKLIGFCLGEAKENLEKFKNSEERSLKALIYEKQLEADFKFVYFEWVPSTFGEIFVNILQNSKFSSLTPVLCPKSSIKACCMIQVEAYNLVVPKSILTNKTPENSTNHSKTHYPYDSPPQNEQKPIFHPRRCSFPTIVMTCDINLLRHRQQPHQKTNRKKVFSIFQSNIIPKIQTANKLIWIFDTFN